MAVTERSKGRELPAAAAVYPNVNRDERERLGAKKAKAIKGRPKRAKVSGRNPMDLPPGDPIAFSALIERLSERAFGDPIIVTSGGMARRVPNR